MQRRPEDWIYIRSKHLEGWRAVLFLIIAAWLVFWAVFGPINFFWRTGL